MEADPAVEDREAEDARVVADDRAEVVLEAGAGTDAVARAADTTVVVAAAADAPTDMTSSGNKPQGKL